MIIGLFNDSYEPVMDGVAVCVRNYAEWLTQRGCEAYVITSSVPDYVDTANFPILRYKSIQLPSMAPYRAGIPAFDVNFTRKVYNIPFDLIHSHCPFVSGSIALKIARKRKIPIITTFHTKYRDDLRRALYFEKTADLALSFILRYYDAVDYVWVPNEATGRTLTEYGYDGEMEIYPNGVDMPVPSEAEHKALRAVGQTRIGVGGNEFVFLFIGQHRWEKNVRLVIEAMNVLKVRGFGFRMVFVGSGYADKEMRRLVTSLDLDDRVLFLGQLVNREELKGLYARADLFLFPSVYDNAPLVVREAAAFGLPSVLARGSSAAEGIVDGQNGFLSDNDLESFVAKLIGLMGDPDVRARAGKGARDSIYVGWSQVVDKVLGRYEEIVANRRRG